MHDSALADQTYYEVPDAFDCVGCGVHIFLHRHTHWPYCLRCGRARNPHGPTVTTADFDSANIGSNPVGGAK
jgi:hypothetical protein